MRIFWIKTSSKSKVSNLCCEIFVKKDIAAFDVSVYYFHSTRSMEKCQPLSCSKDDINPLLPTQDMGRILDCNSNRVLLSVTLLQLCTYSGMSLKKLPGEV